MSAAGAQCSQPWSPPPHPAGLATFGSEYAQFVTHSGAASRLASHWRFPGGVGAIDDFLSLVFARRKVEREQLLLHKQRTTPADDFRNRRLLLSKPILSAFISGPPGHDDHA
jgi:hypothetical protein